MLDIEQLVIQKGDGISAHEILPVQQGMWTSNKCNIINNNNNNKVMIVVNGT